MGEFLINCFMTGRYIHEKLPDETLLDEFRKTNVDELKIRFKDSEEFKQNIYCSHEYHPLLTGIKRIRSMFGVEDIIKLYNINILYYNYKEFEKIVNYNIEIAKSLYEKYIDICEEIGKVPNDIEIYLSLFNLKLGNRSICNAVSSGERQKIETVLKFTDIKDIKIEYRHYRYLLNNNDLEIISLLDLIYEHGIHIWTDDAVTEKLLMKCNHRNPNRSI